MEESELKEELGKLSDEWWDYVLAKAKADENLMRRSLELNKGISMLIDRL